MGPPLSKPLLWGNRSAVQFVTFASRRDNPIPDEGEFLARRFAVISLTRPASPSAENETGQLGEQLAGSWLALSGAGKVQATPPLTMAVAIT